MMPLVGFLPATDPRVLGTVEAIQKHLMSDGLVARYQTTPELYGLPPTFWLTLPRPSRAPQGELTTPAATPAVR
jgi:GH15 family glucan-1,4-alpha-glucosidase